MTAKELKTIRTAMNLDIKSMAVILGWPYRTYQDRELGNRGIPETAAEEVLAARQRDSMAVRRAMAAVNEMIARQFPQGIQSEAT